MRGIIVESDLCIEGWLSGLITANNGLELYFYVQLDIVNLYIQSLKTELAVKTLRMLE